MRIDFHTHAFADKIADKAVEQLIAYYELPTTFGGRLPDLLQQAVAARLDALVLLVAATRPEQVKPANDWILQLARTPPTALRDAFGLPSMPEIVPFGTLHPDDVHWPEEIARLRTAGIRGIKLHPEFQGIDLADARLLPIFEEIAGDFLLLVHVGDPHVSADNLSTPAKIAALHRQVPTLTLIAAHMGGYCFWEEAYRELAGTSIYLDTSSVVAYMPTDLLRAMIDRHGVERILMGSDYPLSSPQRELGLLAQCRWLSDVQREAITGGNAARLLGLAT